MNTKEGEVYSLVKEKHIRYAARALSSLFGDCNEVEVFGHHFVHSDGKTKKRIDCGLRSTNHPTSITKPLTESSLLLKLVASKNKKQ